MNLSRFVPLISTIKSDEVASPSVMTEVKNPRMSAFAPSSPVHSRGPSVVYDD